MKKQTKVLLAAAMMTLGASFSALAAPLTNGTWVQNEEGWQYFNKDGEPESNVWADSNGYDFYIGEDEYLVSNMWVEEEFESGAIRRYYAKGDGSKVKNAWRELYNWEDEEEENGLHWYRFDEKGRMYNTAEELELETGTYYFDANGEMLTGIQKINGEIFYLVDGVKATGKTMIEDKDDEAYTFYFAPEKDDTYSAGAAVTGNVDGYCYNNGMLQTSGDKDYYKVVTVSNGDKFIVDHNGKIYKSTTTKYDTEDMGEVEVASYVKTKGYSKHSVTLEQ